MPDKVKCLKTRHLIDFSLINGKMRFDNKNEMYIFYPVTFSIYHYMGKIYSASYHKSF